MNRAHVQQVVDEMRRAAETAKALGHYVQTAGHESAYMLINADAKLVSAWADALTAALTELPASFQLNPAQERAVKEWAADDRLWTTQETVEFNLRVFAREIEARAVPVIAPNDAPRLRFENEP